jgi:quinol-cytochrome oxidoreductase complex cytochrome b subunit
MTVFLWGALAMASFTIALFFFRFWVRTRERLFVLFGAAFLVFALNWTVLGILQPGDESRPYAYMLRWLAFLLILVGILDKNR